MLLGLVVMEVLLIISKSYQASLVSHSYIDGISLSDSEFLIFSNTSSNKIDRTYLNTSGESKKFPSLDISYENSKYGGWLYFPSQNIYIFFRTNQTNNIITLHDSNFNYLKTIYPDSNKTFGLESFSFLLSDTTYISAVLYFYTKVEGLVQLNHYEIADKKQKPIGNLSISPLYGKYISIVKIESQNNRATILMLYEKEKCKFNADFIILDGGNTKTNLIFSSESEKCEYSKLIKLKNNYLSFVIQAGTSLHFLFGELNQEEIGKVKVFDKLTKNVSCSASYHNIFAELSDSHIISIFRENDNSGDLTLLTIKVSYNTLDAKILFQQKIKTNDSPTRLKLKKFGDIFVFLYSYTEGKEYGVKYMLINKLNCVDKTFNLTVDSDYRFTVHDLLIKSEIYMSNVSGIKLESIPDGYFKYDNGVKVQLDQFIDGKSNLTYHSPSISGKFSMKFKSINFKDKPTDSCSVTFKVIDPYEIENTIKRIMSQKTLNNYPNKVVEEDYTIQVYSTKNPPGKNKSGTSIIDLGECKKELLKHYPKLSEDDELFIATVDIKVKDSKTNKVEYKVFDSKRTTELDLKYCKGIKIEVSYALTDANLTKAKEMMERNSVDIYNPKDSFFNDICVPYSTNKVDVVLSDRRKDIYENISICEENCEYQGIDFQTEKANCSCFVKVIFNTSIEEDFSDEIKGKNSFITDIIPINIDVMKCYKEFFSFSNLKDNIGFWFSTTLILINCSLFGFFFKEFRTWKIKISSLIDNKVFAPPEKKKQRKKSSSNSVASTNKTLNSLSTNIICKEKVQKTILDTEEEKFDYDPKKFEFEKKDVNNYPFEVAYEKDKRNCFKMFWKSLLDKHMFLRAIFIKSEFEIISISLSVYVSYLGLYFTLNALFYTNSLISERYHRNQDIGFFKNIAKSIISCLMSAILLAIIKFSGKFSILMDSIVQEAKLSQDFCRLCAKLVKVVQRNIIIFFIIELIFSVFFLYYLSCFCIIYHSTQMSWFRGGLISFCISLFVCLGFCIGFSVFRYFSLRLKSKNLYNFQLFINKYY